MDELEIPKEDGADFIYNLLKGGVGTFGVIPAEIFGLIFSAPITKRKEKWMIAVVEKLREIENFSPDFIEKLKQNDEFISFILESSQIALKTHQEEKIQILKNTISNFFLNSTVDYDKKYSFLKVIDTISPTHLKILYFISKYENFIVENIKGYPELHEKYSEVENIDKFYFMKCVIDLQNLSLIRVSRDFADFYRGGGFATDTGAPSIKVLDFGVEFIEFIDSKE